MWKKHNGEIPSLMCVCHKCDMPSCVNPEHLFLGTHKDNMADRAKKGRYLHKGERNNSAKLTELEVAMIRKLINEGSACLDLAREFGVSDGMIGHIKHNRAWV